MNITLTNHGAEILPYASTKGEGFVIAVPPGGTTATDDVNTTVAVAGEKPNFIDEFTDALKEIAEALGRLITFWREHSTPYLDEGEPAVNVSIVNHGPNALRVILGDPTNDVQVEAGATYQAVAPGYVEIRELGV